MTIFLSHMTVHTAVPSAGDCHESLDLLVSRYCCEFDYVMHLSKNKDHTAVPSAGDLCHCSSTVVPSMGMNVVACVAKIEDLTRKAKTKNMHVQFDDNVIFIDIPSVESATRRPDTHHMYAYRHSDEVRSLDPSTEQRLAHLAAMTLRRQLEVEYGIKHVGSNYIVSAPAEVERGIRRWLVDTGCPIDLIAEGDLEKHELEYVKTTSKPVMLSTANGSTKSEQIISSLLC